MKQETAAPQQTQTKWIIAGRWIKRAGIAVAVLGSAYNLASTFYFTPALDFGAFTGTLAAIDAVEAPLILGAIIYVIGALISRRRR